MESIPQTHLTLILFLFGAGEIAFTDGHDDEDGIDPAFVTFLLGFISSVTSASLGMTRLLMNGPSKLIKKQGPLGGYIQVGVTLMFFSIMFVLISPTI